MKTLQPKTNSSTIVPIDYFSKINAEIDELKSIITNANTRIADLENELNSSDLIKENGYFDNLNATNKVTSLNAEIDFIKNKELVSDTIKVDRIDSDTINSDSFIGNKVKTNSAEFDELVTQEQTTNNITAENAILKNITSESITSDSATFNKAIIEEAEIKSTIIPSLALNSVSSNKAEVVELETTNAKAESIKAESSELNGALITTLTNGFKLFDKRNSQEVGTTNNEPFYITLPKIENGSYRVVLVNSQKEVVASLVVVDSGKAPLVTYTKKNDALTAIVYNDSITIESYLLNGTLYYSSDDYENTIPPAYSVNKPAGSTYYTTAESRVVILGDETAYYGLDVLGSLKASIFVDSNKNGSPLFYSGGAEGLISQLNTYLPKGSISVAGYVYDNDNSYSIQTITRNDDNSITCFVEDSEGTGTNSFDLTIDTPYKFGLFTTTFEWDKNVNG